MGVNATLVFKSVWGSIPEGLMGSDLKTTRVVLTPIPDPNFAPFLVDGATRRLEMLPLEDLHMMLQMLQGGAPLSKRLPCLS